MHYKKPVASFYCRRCGIFCCYIFDETDKASDAQEISMCHACAEEMDNALIEDYIATGVMKRIVPLPFVEKPKLEPI